MRLDSPVVSKLTFKPGAAVADSSFTGSFSGSYVGDGTSIEGVVYSNLASTPAGILSGSTNQARLTDISGLAVTDSGVIVGDGSNFVLESGATLRTSLGLGNLDNTSDANKPVSTAGQTALDLKANIASPTFTGTVGGVTAAMVGLGNVDNESKATMFAAAALTGNSTAVTQADNDDSTKIATTAFVMREVGDILGGAPAALDTLLELSASISNGDSDVVALTTTVGTKLAKASNLSDLADASTARGNLGVDAAGTDNSTNVSLTGTPDYITISGQVITRNQIDLANDVTGVLPSANLDSDTAHLSGTQTFTGAKSFNEAVNINKTTEASSKTSGALIVDGGVGIAKALQVGGDVVAYASSDERLKDNIQNIENPIEKVQSLKGVTWDWNDNADEVQQSLPNVGVIAQDVEKVLPQLVTDRDNGFKGVDYAKLTGLLIEAVKDQQKQIDELKSKLS